MHFKYKTNYQHTTDLRQAENGVQYITFRSLEELQMVKHGFSTRLGGVSGAEYTSLNFSFTRTDTREHTLANYTLMAEALGVEEDSFVLANQTHTTNIQKVDISDKGRGISLSPYADIDGLMTNRRGITLVTFFADCIPLYFVDTEHMAIGLAHSGWRGSYGGIGTHMLEQMAKEYGTRSEDVYVGIGIGICKDCYEIGEEVANLFCQKYDFIDRDILSRFSNVKYHLDLCKFNQKLLEKAGVKKEHISIADICTACNPDIFFSHRIHGERRGNLAAFLAIS